MSKLGGLVCPDCGAELEVSVAYDGCDWDSVAGEGSGFCWCVSLDCTACSRTFPVGRVKRSHHFSENKESDSVVARLSRL